jgi:hypothetical protein
MSRSPPVVNPRAEYNALTVVAGAFALDEAERVVQGADGTVGVAEQPARQRQIVVAAHTGIVAAVQERRRDMPIAVVEDQAPFDVEGRRRRLAHGEERWPQGVVGLQELFGVVVTLRTWVALAGLARRAWRPRLR